MVYININIEYYLFENNSNYSKDIIKIIKHYYKINVKAFKNFFLISAFKRHFTENKYMVDNSEI